MHNYNNPRRPRTDILNIFNDSIVDTVVKLAEGNPGAVTVISQLLKDSPSIDPDSAFAGYGPLLMLDSMGIYGSEIWILYKNVCLENLHQMVLLLRSVQLGFVTWNEVYDELDDPHTVGLKHRPWAELNAKVCDRLEGFKSL